MFLAQVKNLASDCQKTHRWALVNLTGDDGNADRREKLTQVRVIGIGTRLVRIMEFDGKISTVDPFLIQRVW